MSAQAPSARLAPQDFYRQLDWLRDEWGQGDVFTMMKKVTRLRRLYEHLPERYYTAAVDVLDRLKRYDDAPDTPYHERIRELVEIVRAWDQSRPPLHRCPECGIERRGHRDLRLHRSVVHDVQGNA